MKKTYKKLGNILYILLLPFIRILIKKTTRAYVAIEHEGRVLLIKNWLARDTWRFPGGGLRKEESPRQAVAREVKEELRIIIDPSKLVEVHTGIHQVDNLGFKYHLFLYHISIFPRLLVDGYEVTETSWVSKVPARVSDDISEAMHLVFAKLV